MNVRLGGGLFIVSMMMIAEITLPSSASAHHAIQAEFDFEKPVSLTGTLWKIEWINPHPYIHLDVKDEKGNVQKWELYTIGVGGLKKVLSRTGSAALKIGETYTINGFAARDGSRTAYVKEIIFPDGRMVTIWVGDPKG